MNFGERSPSGILSVSQTPIDREARIDFDNHARLIARKRPREPYPESLAWG